MTRETLEQNEPTLRDVLQAIAEMSKKIDGIKKESDAQFESIRQGIVDINIRLDRVESIALATRANLTQFTEEVIHNRKVLV